MEGKKFPLRNLSKHLAKHAMIGIPFFATMAGLDHDKRLGILMEAIETLVDSEAKYLQTETALKVRHLPLLLAVWP